jgi:hypothetical protein
MSTDVESSLATKLHPHNPTSVQIERMQLTPGMLRDLLFTALRLCGFEAPKVDEAVGTATAIRTLPIPPPLSGTRRTMAVVGWLRDPSSPKNVLVGWIAIDQSPGSRNRIDDRSTHEIGARIRSAASVSFLGMGEIDYPLDPIIGPGERLQGPFAGNLRDYSVFATLEDTQDLREGTLPLGRYCFRPPHLKNEEDDTPLFLSRDETGTRDRRGVLICAPQNSGKTTLLANWAKAANQGGYSLFLIDVKGNLHHRLGTLKGDVFRFTTDPSDETGDRINLLQDLDPFTAVGSERIRDLATALLPRESAVNGGKEDQFLYRNWVTWLTAMFHLVKLREAYCPEHYLEDSGERREADLSDVYAIAVDEKVLFDYINVLRNAEAIRKSNGEPLAHCGVDYWVLESLHLLDPQKSPPSFLLEKASLDDHSESLSSEVKTSLVPIVNTFFSTEELFRGELEEVLPEAGRSEAIDLLLALARQEGDGAKEPQHSYRDYTQGIVTALQPFNRGGTLYARVRSKGEGNLFSLSALDRADTQTTIILTAREQDQEKASTVLAVAIKRIMHLMLDRVSRANKTRSILLLLDETRRIRDFEANRYITFAREAEAGCVVVYQSLDQIGNDRKISEILENVGTQIYLGSLVGNTAQHFLKLFPKRYRTMVHEQFSYSMDGRNRTLIVGRELVDFMSTNELYDLPSGRRPALVYINDLPRRKPILVDMYDEEASLQWRSATPLLETM